MKIIASSQKALISLTLGGFECCKSCTRETNKVGTKFSWFGWPDCPRNVRAKFLGRRGKVLHWLTSVVGMAYQSHLLNVNRAIPDDRVARSNTRWVGALWLRAVPKSGWGGGGGRNGRFFDRGGALF